MPKWTSAAKVGFFAVLLVAAAYGIWRYVSRTAGTEGGYVVYADLKDAAGLAPQSRVMMAGIPVGVVKSIRLVGGKARVDIKMRRDVALHDDATIARRSTTLLSEFFLQVTPGSEDRPVLKDGDAIPIVIDPVSTEQIMNDLARIADRVKIVSESLANTLGTPEGQAQMQATLRNLAEVTDRLNRTVAENRELIHGILQDVKGITGRSAPEVQEILKNVRSITAEVNKLVADNKGGVEGSLGEIRETVERVNRASKSLESALQHIDSVAGRIDRGEGTVGRLTKDETLINEVQGVVEGVGDFVGSISRLQTIVGLRSEYNFHSGGIKSYLELRLQPAEDKYYVVELINDPRGRTTFEQIDEDTTDPTRPPHVRTVRTTTTNAFRFSLQLARRLGPFTGRFGIKESTGGVGLDTHLFADRVEVRQDLFGFGEQARPRWRMALSYEFLRKLWFLLGVDDIVNADRRDYFVGLQLRFNDQDLKTILPFTPSTRY